jgi:HupE/UreJ protein
MRTRSVIPLVLACSCLSGLASAHELYPATLQLLEIETGRLKVIWKVPRFRESRPAIEPIIRDYERVTETTEARQLNAFIDYWEVQARAGAVGSWPRVEVTGLEEAQVDVVVLVTLIDGGSREALLTAARPSCSFDLVHARADTRLEYLHLGIRHILGGVDHLLFVFGLMLLCHGSWMLFKTITAFTLGHSLTLGMAVLGYVTVPSGPLEVLIAFSIFLLALELASEWHNRQGLGHRLPWLFSSLFGLLHGFGFASALQQTGLPSSAVPMALFQFNLGVEIGQLLFALPVLLVIMFLRRTSRRLPIVVQRLPVLALGGLAAWFVFNRTAGWLFP